jgi:hypothetical protein
MENLFMLKIIISGLWIYDQRLVHPLHLTKFAMYNYGSTMPFISYKESYGYLGSIIVCNFEDLQIL